MEGVFYEKNVISLSVHSAGSYTDRMSSLKFIKSKTLTQTLNAGGNVNLGGKTFSENAAINTANITVSNANLGGKTLTINKAGVTLKNITNANLVIGEGVGNGDVTVDSCSFNNVTVNGGGANSIHFKTTTVTRVVVSKKSVRVVLEGDTKVTTAEISGNGAKLEAEANSTAKVSTLEVAPNTSGVQIQKVEAETIVLKENVKNVTISEVKADTLEVKENAQNTTITSATVKTIEIEKEVEKIKIEACAVETAKVSNEAGNVEVAGGALDNLQVVKTKTSTEIKAVITISKTETVIKNAEVVVSNGTITAQPVTVVVTDDVNKATLDIPPTVEAVTITNTAFDVSLVTAEYKTGTVFDKSNAFIILTYSNGNTNKISVNPENITVTGFNSSAETQNQTVTLKTTYNGKNLSQNISVTITQMPDYIGRGTDLIMAGFYDEGVAQFKQYYTENPNSDEAKMFYALAELSAVSTDENIAKLLKENFDIEGYPATMNALIRGDWLADVPDTKNVHTNTLTKAENGSLVRCDIDESVEKYKYMISYILDEDGDWLDGETWQWNSKTHTNTYTQLYITGVVKPSATGKYMVYRWNITNPEIIDPTAPSTVELPAGTPLWNCTDTSRKKVLSAQSISLPQINISDWFKTTKAYKNSLVKGVINSETLGEALVANFISCNPDGVNGLLDKCIAIFESDKIANARSIANSMTGTISIPESIITTFGLEEMLGEDEIYFGKTEFNVLLSALDIIKGTLQFISSYDLSFNLYELKQMVADDLDDLTEEAAKKLINSKTLAARSDAAARIAKAKESYTGAISTIITSYDTMFGENGYYPEFIADMVTPYGDALKPALVSLKDAIANEGKFYIDMAGLMDDEPSWTPTTKDLGIDFGKLFTPGYFSSIIPRNAQGLVDIYVQIEGDFRYHSDSPKIFTAAFEPADDEENNYDDERYHYHYSFRTEPVLKSSFNLNNSLAALKEDYARSGYRSDENGNGNASLNVYYGILVNPDAINDLFINAPMINLQNAVASLCGVDYCWWDDQMNNWEIED